MPCWNAAVSAASRRPTATFAHEGVRVDLTREEEGAEQIDDFLHEEEIESRKIGDYKVRAHRGFIRRWAVGRGLDSEHVWRIREGCIATLAG